MKVFKSFLAEAVCVVVKLHMRSQFVGGVGDSELYIYKKGDIKLTAQRKPYLVHQPFPQLHSHFAHVLDL